MTVSELARRLNISRQMVYRLKAKGMPVDDLESAQSWRNRCLNQRKTKSWKVFVAGVKRKNRPWLAAN